jgi:acetoacetyl-CoA synthetase
MDRVPLWKPSNKSFTESHLAKFMQTQNFDTDTDTYELFWKWSVNQPEKFWHAFAEYSKIDFKKESSKIFVENDHFISSEWFPDHQLSFSENLLLKQSNPVAIIYADESGARKTIDRTELIQKVKSTAGFLRSIGLRSGDRVAGYLSNTPETVIAMLASNMIGCIWTACSPDFGATAFIERVGQVMPKVLFAHPQYSFKGEKFNRVKEIESILNDIDSLEHLILIGDHKVNSKNQVVTTRMQDLYSHNEEDEFLSLPFNHPLYILYSSGTTGRPKAIVHGQGGTLIQHKKEHLLHCNIQNFDRVFYYSTCSWMMWHWLVSSLASNATIVLWEGSPFYPDDLRLWKLADDEAINVFGTSAAYINHCKNTGVNPIKDFNLDQMRVILSTGSPLSEDNFKYVYEHVKEDVQLSSIAGGTDLISCFVLGNPLKPVYAGEIQSIGLGMDVDVFDEAGNSIIKSKGELVCKQSFPSKPIYFWDDTEGEKYKKAYFETYPEIWRHGDFAERTFDGSIILYGRSDAVLNRSGIRIGTNEIYQVTNAILGIKESLAVMLSNHDKDQILLFIVLNEGIQMNQLWHEKINSTLRKYASPHHIPNQIHMVSDLPRTANGKIMELAVKEILETGKINNIESVSNKDSLDFFFEFRKSYDF